MNYSLITEEMIVGSQPQKVEDVDHLKEEENVAYILNLQQDKDIEYWGIDLPSIIKSCQRAGIRHMRRPARDFDPDSLRFGLPKAVSSLDWAISEGKGRVYVHCTAGLGRAPAVAIAYMFWFCDMDLNTAYSILTSKRPCGPNKKALRGATYDLAKNDPWKEPFENLPEHAFKDVADWERKQIQVEGLMMDIVAAQEEIIRWKVVAQQEADVGKTVEPDFVAQLLAVRQELEEAKQAVVEFRINLNSKKKQQMLPWQQVNH